MKSMRTEMPNTAAWIDELREAFGAQVIDAQIRAGMKGEPTFFAEEQGHQVGTRVNSGTRSVVAFDNRGIAFAVHMPAGISVAGERQIMDAARATANKRKFDRKGQIINQGK